MNDNVIEKLKKWNKSIYYVYGLAVEPFQLIIGKDWNQKERQLSLIRYMSTKKF